MHSIFLENQKLLFTNQMKVQVVLGKFKQFRSTISDIGLKSLTLYKMHTLQHSQALKISSLMTFEDLLSLTKGFSEPAEWDTIRDYDIEMGLEFAARPRLTFRDFEHFEVQTVLRIESFICLTSALLKFLFNNQECKV